MSTELKFSIGPWKLNSYYEILFKTHIRKSFGAQIPGVKIKPGVTFLCESAYQLPSVRGKNPHRPSWWSGPRTFLRLVCRSPRQDGCLLALDIEINPRRRKLDTYAWREITSPLEVLSLVDEL